MSTNNKTILSRLTCCEVGERRHREYRRRREPLRSRLVSNAAVMIFSRGMEGTVNSASAYGFYLTKESSSLGSGKILQKVYLFSCLCDS